MLLNKGTLANSVRRKIQDASGPHVPLHAHAQGADAGRHERRGLARQPRRRAHAARAPGAPRPHKRIPRQLRDILE